MRRILWTALPALLVVLGPLAAQADDPCEEVGIVTRLTDSEVFIRMPDGDEDSFDLKEETTGLAGLAIGDRIHILCREESDDDVALAIRKMAPGETWANTGCEETGVVTSITDSEIKIRKADGDEDSFDLKMDTTGITGLKLGDRVRIRCYEESDDDVALAITKVEPPSRTAQATSVQPTSAQPTPSASPVVTPPAEKQSVASSTSLPDTAGPLPMIGLLGIGSLAAWIALRRKNRRP